MMPKAVALRDGMRMETGGDGDGGRGGGGDGIGMGRG